MKRLSIVLLSALFVSVLAACSSTPTKEQEGAAVEDRTKPIPGDPSAGKPKPDAVATAKPFVDKPLSANPLKDPANILSKRSVFFDYDSYVIKDEFKPVVSAHGQYLRQNPAAKMKIEGNADDRGSREYNLALGQRRADAVKQALQILGARSEQVETVSFGEEKPRCSQPEEGCWSQNRRGDLVYQGE